MAASLLFFREGSSRSRCIQYTPHRPALPPRACKPRIKILYVLSQSEMCVCDIATLLQMGQSAISHQLRVLKQMRLVSFRRDGKTVFYKLADAHIQTILAQGMEHISE